MILRNKSGITIINYLFDSNQVMVDFLVFYYENVTLSSAHALELHYLKKCIIALSTNPDKELNVINGDQEANRWHHF